MADKTTINLDRYPVVVPPWPPTNWKYLQFPREAANAINLPHEDYPRRVDRTHLLLEMMTIQFGNTGCVVSQSDLKMIHRQVMWDLMPECDRGDWRTCNVRVGSRIAPDRTLVPAYMLQVVPTSFICEADLKEWYVKFNEVHPFRDGNWRVSGIVIAACSKVLGLPGYLVSGV